MMAKRLFSVLLVLCMVLSPGTAKAFAEIIDSPEPAESAETELLSAEEDIYAVLYSGGELVFQSGSAVEEGRTVRDSWNLTELGILENGFASSYDSTTAWRAHTSGISKVTFLTELRPKSTAGWFYGCTYLNSISGMEKLKTEDVTDMSHMFDGCYGLTTLDVSGFNTSKVTDTSYMFHSCQHVTALNVSSFDTSSVTNMKEMFDNCYSVEKLDVSHFDTTNVTDMSSMFSNCQHLTALDVSGFKTGKVTNMYAMFDLCKSLTWLDVSGFDTGNVTNMRGMFNGCEKVMALDVNGFETSNVSDMGFMFQNCAGLRSIDVSSFDTSDVTNMYAMFSGCSGLSELDLINFNTGKVTSMDYMFEDCGNLLTLYLDNFDTSSVTGMRAMFAGCKNLRTIYAGPKFTTANVYGDTTSVIDSRKMFTDCVSLAGGSGTAYHNSHVDQTYARVDGQYDLPGYFTASPGRHKVSFDANGGSVEEKNRQLTNGGTYGELPTPTRHGFRFTGWYTGSENGMLVSPTSIVNLVEDQILYAHWTDTFTVSFDANGGTTDETVMVVTNGKAYGKLPEPTRGNYTFDGWYTEKTGGTKIEPATIVDLTTEPTLYAHWTGIIRTVFFDANGGTVSTQSMTVYYDGSYGELPVPVRAGYSFDGWYTGAEDGGKVDSGAPATLTHDQTLYAHWTAQSYTVRFDPNGGKVAKESATVTYDSAYGELPTPTRTGFAFEGWYTGAEDGEQIELDTKVELTEDHTLYAHWKGNSNIVVFEGNGGSVSTSVKTVRNGAPYGELPIPTKAGYFFAGWYTEAEGGSKVESTDIVMLTDFQTLYAHWTENAASTFTVSFAANGGSGTMAAQAVEADAPTALNANAFTRDGYAFAGWNTVPDGSGTRYTDRAGVTLDADLTLYAQWAVQGSFYTVRFNAAGGTVSPANRRVMSGGAYGVLPAPERTGYRFEGWYDAQEGGNLITSETEAELTGNQTLYARWTARSYTVTFDFNFEEEAPQTKTVGYGALYGKLPESNRIGYRLLYWQDETGREITPESSVLLAKDHTLTAQWRQERYIVTFMMNDGSSMAAATRYVVYGQYYGASMPNTPARSGYAFTGWYTQPEGGAEVPATATVEITGNLTLYAHWLEGSFSVSYNANGGSGAPQAQVKAAGAPLTLSKTQPRRSGYVFTGWAEDKNAAVPAYQPGGRFVQDAPATLYAVWEKETYPVTYDANGGTDAPAEQGKTYGEALALSTAKPRREGYDFLGWAASRYAAAARYQPGAEYSENAPLRLYAVWARSANTLLPEKASDLGYAFDNTAKSFSYKDNSFIPQKAYQTMFGDTQRALKFYLAHQLWTGNCFGMTASAGILFENENKLMPSSFWPGASYARELVLENSSATLHVSLQEFIEALQVSQFSELVQYDLEHNKYDGIHHPDALNDLVDRVRQFQQTGHDPVLVSIYGPSGQGHALLAYRVEDVSAKTVKLWVYDPNYREDDSRYIVLTRENGNFTGWEYALSGRVTWRGPENGKSPISYVPYEDIYAVWTSRGPGLGAGGALVSVNMDVEIRDAGGAWLASVTNGEVSGPGSRSDIYKMDVLGVLLDAQGNILPDKAGENTTYLWLPVDRYTIERAAPLPAGAGLLGDAEPLEISLTHTNQSANVKTGANAVILDVDDGQDLNYVRFAPADSGRSYEVALSSGYGETGQEVCLSGTVAENSGTALSKIEGNVAVLGVDESTATLTINDVEQSLYGGLGAVLIEMPVLVSVSAGGGAGTMPALAVTGDTLTLPACGLEAPLGQTFAGWKLNGGDKVYNPGESAEILADAVITATWKESNDKYLVQSAQVGGDSVSALVQNIRGNGGTLLASSYDSDGRLLDVKTCELLPDFTAGRAQDILVRLLTEDAATVKIFVCDVKMRPLGPDYTWERG